MKKKRTEAERLILRAAHRREVNMRRVRRADRIVSVRKLFDRARGTAGRHVPLVYRLAARA